MNQDFFVDHFKATASFIKPQKMSENLPMNPLFVNASASITAETYKEITKVQRQALKKISHAIRQDSGEGPIPVFFLCALDTLDTDSAFEIAVRDEKKHWITEYSLFKCSLRILLVSWVIGRYTVVL